MQVDFSKYQKKFKPWKLPNGGEFTDYSHIVNFFSHFIVGIKPGKKCQSFRAFCHDDRHNSLIVNFAKGLWSCAACKDINGMKGDLVDFYQKWCEIVDDKKVDFKEAQTKVIELMGDIPEQVEKDHEKAQRPRVPLQLVNVYHDKLMSNKKLLDGILDVRGWTLETIQKYRIGWTGKGENRLTIPISNKDGDLVNIRLYNTNATPKMLSHAAGYGEMELFPYSAFTTEGKIYLCEGESDTLLMLSLGYNAVTVTGGAGSWINGYFGSFFKDKDVVMIYDSDPAGQAGKNRVLMDLRKFTKTCRVLDLFPNNKWNEDNKGQKDITDFWKLYGAEALRAKIEGV